MREARLDAALVRRIHQRAHAAKWGLTFERFDEVLQTSVAHALGDSQTSATIERYVE